MVSWQLRVKVAPLFHHIWFCYELFTSTETGCRAFTGTAAWETCLAGRDREISRRPHSQWPCDRVLLSNPATSWCYRHRNVAIGKTKPCDDALSLADGMPPNSVKVLSRSNPSTLGIWRLSWDRHITPAPIVMCCSNYCASFNMSYEGQCGNAYTVPRTTRLALAHLAPRLAWSRGPPNQEVGSFYLARFQLSSSSVPVAERSTFNHSHLCGWTCGWFDDESCIRHFTNVHEFSNRTLSCRCCSFLKEVFHLPIPSSSKEYRAKHGKAAPGCQKHRDAFFLGSNNDGWQEDVQNMTGTINPEGLMDLRPWLRHMNLLSEARDDLKAKEPNEIWINERNHQHLDGEIWNSSKRVL